LAGMANMTIVALITRNSMGTNELRRVLMTDVTKGGGARGWWRK
jgi:hypothetical protein